MEPTLERSISDGLDQTLSMADDFLTGGDLTLDHINNLTTGHTPQASADLGFTDFDTSLLSDIHGGLDSDLGALPPFPSASESSAVNPALQALKDEMAMEVDSPHSNTSEIYVPPLPKVSSNKSSPMRSPIRSPQKSPRRLSPSPSPAQSHNSPSPPRSRKGAPLPRVATLSKPAAPKEPVASKSRLGPTTSAARRAPGPTTSRPNTYNTTSSQGRTISVTAPRAASAATPSPESSAKRSTPSPSSSGKIPRVAMLAEAKVAQAKANTPPKKASPAAAPSWGTSKAAAPARSSSRLSGPGAPSTGINRTTSNASVGSGGRVSSASSLPRVSTTGSGRSSAAGTVGTGPGRSAGTSPTRLPKPPSTVSTSAAGAGAVTALSGPTSPLSQKPARDQLEEVLVELRELKKDLGIGSPKSGDQEGEGADTNATAMEGVSKEPENEGGDDLSEMDEEESAAPRDQGVHPQIGGEGTAGDAEIKVEEPVVVDTKTEVKPAAVIVAELPGDEAPAKQCCACTVM